MTRKDYELIARVMRNAQADDPMIRPVFYLWLNHRFINALSDDNPRFNADTFLQACRPQEKGMNDDI